MLKDKLKKLAKDNPDTVKKPKKVYSDKMAKELTERKDDGLSGC
jgi:hypothetical protein